MVSLGSLNVASTLVSQSLANLTALNANPAQDPLLAANQTRNQNEDGNDLFAVDLTQSLLDKELEAALKMIELDADQAAALENGAFVAAAYIELAKSAYAEVSAALADKVEAKNEKSAALAVEGLEVASLENVKEMIDEADGAEGTEAATESADAGEALDKQAEEAQEAIDALKELPA